MADPAVEPPVELAVRLSRIGTFTRPGGLPRGLVILLGAAALVIVVAGLQATAWLIGPAFMALIIVIAVAPVQGWMRR